MFFIMHDTNKLRKTPSFLSYFFPIFFEFYKFKTKNTEKIHFPATSGNEISVNSDRKMMSVVIFVLFRRSNKKLLNTNFVQFFEIYNFCFRNFFIWAIFWKLFNYFKNYQLKVLSFHVTTSIFSLRPQLDFYYSCYCGYVYKISGILVDLIESCFKSRTNMIWIGYQFMWIGYKL